MVSFWWHNGGMSYSYVTDSRFRTWETAEHPDNWYGRVLHNGIPVICGHGGSMWLCAACGHHLIEHQTEWNFPEAPEVSR